MTRSKKKSSVERPFPLNVLMGIYRAAASMQVAVVLIAVTTVLLVWATFVYNQYGETAARFGIYGTWWFNTLGTLLAVNILLATLIRIPWTRRQTGFVVTHVGLLVLLFGCLVTHWWGEEATLAVYETRSNSQAYMPSQHFQLTVVPAEGTEKKDDKLEPIEIPFEAGPFNWEDLRQKFWFPWRVAHRDKGVLYNKDGIKLELFDYYSDSNSVSAPRVELEFDVPSDAMRGHGQFGDDRTQLTLSVQSGGHGHMAAGSMGMGQRRSLSTGHRVVFYMTDDSGQRKAFVDSAPEGPLGSKGQIVLHVEGEKYQLDVEKLSQGRMPLGTTGKQVELLGFDPAMLEVRLAIHGGEGQPAHLRLFADMPEFNRHNKQAGAYGSFWFDASQLPQESEQNAEKARREATLPRIDILQGDDQKLYMRTWHSPKVRFAGPLDEEEGSATVAFEDTDAEVALVVEDFISAERPGLLPKPVPFDKKKCDNDRQFHQALVELTVDGKSRKFWIEGIPPEPMERPLNESQRKIVEGKNRSVIITMPRDEINLGFAVNLKKFTRKLDPGTSRASHYSSLVDFLEVDEKDKPNEKKQPGEKGKEPKPLVEDVLISLNAPVDFAGPKSGHSYRLFQASFSGPFQPGNPVFESIVGDDLDRERLFLSSLSVNHDPGRGIKYAGSLLIVLGIFIMYYMRAYFFRGKKPKDNVQPGEAEADETAAEAKNG